MGKPKILIVDDEIHIRKLLEAFFIFNGCHVDCATDGFDALKFVENGCYNLLVVDYQMPNLNGVEFVKKVREKWTSVPIFAMSASNASNVKDLFLKAGADFFHIKTY